MEHTPLTKQRSAWEPLRRGEMLGYEVQWMQRKVRDGTLVACYGQEGIGWHMSISFRDHRGELTRYPTWDEIVHARDALLPADVGFVMHLPPAGEYVALHDTTFHLHEFPERGPDA